MGRRHHSALHRVQRLPHIQQRCTQISIALCILPWLLGLRSSKVTSMPGTV